MNIVITPGEPAGIGFDVVLTGLPAVEKKGVHYTVIADANAFRERADQLKVALPSSITVQHIPTAQPVIPGHLTPHNAQYVLETLDKAIEGCLEHRFDAWVTGPVHKGIINEAGIGFTGHTDYIAQKTHSLKTVMMLMDGSLKIALLTTHIPLREVANHVNEKNIIETLRILHHDLQHTFSIHTPRIGVCGLNPHAGEGGHIGDEEVNIIEPTLKKLREEGIQTVGPLPADTAFTPHILNTLDVVLALYHDQGLPVIKHRGFGETVNVTLGLPFIRTSVDHGTALSLAGTRRIHSSSFEAATRLAQQLIR
ncbi:MAG TPA: 4-hydroxythreonine-4-phosphate dehydrogenase PdxA [Coxiellaceae bacterium]|nr:4-hydroxythreonine-4-phosphate dehydrogenase PdxA [Coxiellaceae bacterium]